MNLYETWKSLAAWAAPGRTQPAFRQYCSCFLSYGTSDFYAALRTSFAMRQVSTRVALERPSHGEKETLINNQSFFSMSGTRPRRPLRRRLRQRMIFPAPQSQPHAVKIDIHDRRGK